jgi:hypothetical protein
MHTEVLQLKKKLERELARTRASVACWHAQINDSFYTIMCANLCLEIHQQHLARLEAFASERD